MFQHREIQACPKETADEFQTIIHFGSEFVVLENIQQLSKLLASENADSRLITLSDTSRLQNSSWLDIDYTLRGCTLSEVTNNFWTVLLPSGSRRLDYAELLKPGETFGEWHVRSNSVPNFSSLKLLKMTVEQLYQEIANTVRRLGLQDIVREKDEKLAAYERAAGEFLNLNSGLTYEEWPEHLSCDPIRGDAEFDRNVVYPVLCAMVASGFSLWDLN